MPDTALVWLRRDLRLDDNPALSAALSRHETVIPVYIEPDTTDPARRQGAASDWWLHHSLAALAASLHALGSRLVLRRGECGEQIQSLVADSGAGHVYWNRLYEPGQRARDAAIERELKALGIATHGYNSALLFEPRQIATKSGGPYRVFTPFWRACLAAGLPPAGSPAPDSMPAVDAAIHSLEPDALRLLPARDWYRSFEPCWRPGEAGALVALDRFLDEAVAGYSDDRDRPDHAGTSALSPHLHFGEISPRRVVEMVHAHSDRQRGQGVVAGSDSFIRELGWREFAYHLLYHFPHTVDRPLLEKFAGFPWARDYADVLTAWQQGRTGIPIVDAGMRQLWQTGWMHNRVRMITASLLTKNLLVPWQEGAAWFEDTLVDADLASNTQGWQWVAGCGADAAPYFRIFNPVTQAGKFDPDGAYIRRWVPEIAALPDRYLAAPWTAPVDVLRDCGIEPGVDYPEPVVDLKTSRQRALDAYAKIRAA